MAKASHTIELTNGTGYVIRMGWNAIRRIEEVLKMTTQEIGLRMVAGQSGITELGVVFWAGLETARIHEKSRGLPYTIEEVGNIIDEIGSDVFFDVVYPQLLVAFAEAFPSVKKKLDEKEAKEAAAKGKDPQHAAPTDGIGTDSSATPQNTD